MQNQSYESGGPYGSLFLQIEVIFLWKVFTRTRFGTDNSEMATLRSKVSVGKQKAGFSVFCPRLSVFLWSPTPRNIFIRRLANGLLQARAISEMRYARLWVHKPLKTSPHRKSFMNEKKDRTWPRVYYRDLGRYKSFLHSLVKPVDSGISCDNCALLL